MRAAIRVEAMKLTRSLVGIIATALLVGGVVVLVGGMMAALAAGDPQLVAKLGPAATRDWAGMLATAAQIIGAGGLLGFGVVLAWLFAREFADGTISGLFGLPVGRGTIAAAKIALYGVWAVVVSILTAGGMLALGLLLGFGVPGVQSWWGLGRQVVLGILTAAIALPVAWVATAARSLLGGVATAVGLVVIAQVGAIAGAGGWMPFAAPALWAISGGSSVSGVQLLIPVLLALAVAGATIAAWHRLQLDR